MEQGPESRRESLEAIEPVATPEVSGEELKFDEIYQFAKGLDELLDIEDESNDIPASRDIPPRPTLAIKVLEAEAENPIVTMALLTASTGTEDVKDAKEKGETEEWVNINIEDGEDGFPSATRSIHIIHSERRQDDSKLEDTVLTQAELQNYFEIFKSRAEANKFFRRFSSQPVGASAIFFEDEVLARTSANTHQFPDMLPNPVDPIKATSFKAVKARIKQVYDQVGIDKPSSQIAACPAIYEDGELVEPELIVSFYHMGDGSEVVNIVESYPDEDSDEDILSEQTHIKASDQAGTIDKPHEYAAMQKKINSDGIEVDKKSSLTDEEFFTVYEKITKRAKNSSFRSRPREWIFSKHGI